MGINRKWEGGCFSSLLRFSFSATTRIHEHTSTMTSKGASKFSKSGSQLLKRSKDDDSNDDQNIPKKNFKKGKPSSDKVKNAKKNLFRAIKDGDMEQVSELISLLQQNDETSQFLNELGQEKGFEGRTYLHIASACGNVEIMAQLVAAGK
jgi:hypothetical protein